MPDFNTLPERGSLSIEDALMAGKKSINGYGRTIMVSGLILAILLAFVSLWFLPVLIVISIVTSIIYTSIVRSRWRMWAYSGVTDIHQFQRSAELAGLLYKQSPMEIYGIMSKEQKKQLIELQQRFLEDEPFIDDPQFGEESKIFTRELLPTINNPTPEIIISDKGIWLRPNQFIPWNAIQNERVATKTMHNQGGSRLGGDLPSYSREYFCFSCGRDSYEKPLSELNITAEQIDLILNIHRGRYEQMP